MGTSVYNKCKQVLAPYKGKTLTIYELKGIIVREIGSQEGTIKQALETMGMTGLIQDLDNSRFKVL